MNIDISKFHQVFYDDSLENIDVVERLLIDMDLQNIDEESLNAIFRCAHSIKGSSGMFGFTDISQFTHILESYLELIRSKTIPLTQQGVDVILKSLDCLRSMINDKQNHTETSPERYKVIEKDLITLSKSENITDHGFAESAVEPVFKNKASDQVWKIYFKPHIKIFQNGDDPLRILRLLREIGKFKCEVDLKSIQAIDKFYPDECYMAWHIELDTKMNEKEIRQYAFEWVEDQSTLEFQAINLKQKELPKVTKPHDTNVPHGVGETQSIRVNLEKVDELINIAGELIITQLMLTDINKSRDLSKNDLLQKGFLQLEQNCRELQEKIMSIRMLPMSNVFNRFPRMIRDLSKEFNKKIELKTAGESAELDKTLLEKIIDPLVHLVRNAIDHGIESPEERKAQGKSATGTLTLNAFHQGSNMVITVSDDGRGLNYEKILQKAKEKKIIGENEMLTTEEINTLIFHSGISTATKVTDISGRGIGMDVVRKNVESVNGKIQVTSIPNKGTTFTIRLPLTLAIVDGQLIRIGDTICIIPLMSMVETIRVTQSINKVNNLMDVYNYRGNYISIIRLYEYFNIENPMKDLEKQFLVIIELNGRYFGIVVDELLQLQQVVIKSIANNYNHVKGVSGATVLGDGSVALILDVESLIQSIELMKSKSVA